MLSQLLVASPAVALLAPPYDRFETIPDASALDPHTLPCGSLLAVELAAPAEEWPAVAGLVPKLRARCPAAPVVLHLPTTHALADLDLGRRAGALHVRAVLAGGESPAAALRRALTDDTALADEIAAWLPLRLPAVGPAVVELVREIVRRAPLHREVRQILRELGFAERTARTWCRREGVPGPGAWLSAAHALRAALRLQAGTTPLLVLAVDCGYSDHSSLSRQCLRLFGTRPGAIRGLLGWEWLLDRWLGRVSA
jgi:AraC-like DNA-binding protein